MGKKKKIEQVIITETVDNNGVLVSSTSERIMKVPATENYVKLFCNCLGKLVGMSQSEADLFHQVITTMGYNNMICFSGPARQIIAKSLDISEKTLEKAIKELKERSIIIPIKVNNVVKRGWYIVNPNFAAKGQFQQIEALKMMISFEANGETFLSLGGTTNGITTMSEPFPFELPKELKR